MDTREAFMAQFGGIDQLISELEEKYRKDPENQEIKSELATSYSLSSKPERGIPLFSELLEKSPNDPRLMLGFGYCFMDLDQDIAMNIFQEVIKMSQHTPVEKELLSLAHTNLGAIGKKDNLYEFAYDYYKMSLRIFPENHLAKKYIKRLEDLANSPIKTLYHKIYPDGSIKLRTWDGSYFSETNVDRVDISKMKIK